MLLSLAAAGCATTDIDGDPQELGQTDESIQSSGPDFSVPPTGDPYASESEDSWAIPPEELDADGVTSTLSGSETTLRESASRTGCNGILLKWHTVGGSNRSACVGRPCRANPNGEACRVRRAIGRYFSQYVSALSVAYCESRFDPGAANGQYHGLYQLSSDWRDYYNIGTGFAIRGNVSAAFRIKNHYGGNGLGWGPWSCRPGWR